ncbi:hypothetical protein EMIHUDRAFT_460835 [Emiliania huxleyi CCMP1516]|uniref:Uncharacterized protein n=2 Tax=Emiliania huxleyi TaxID=2903 RepID=A0A0D3IL68_EMIH1|nr:hypothetical protein EMIHUDRAFT_460835 [Emiliania huxleyi CCMP1516]EOD12003.1 hypothetical protein EMIHUDRAFT_460835 [Emiliania huxleyi CCMP1516]|eukprot:XP_005764432.1 hypothetical protein EMIHUDRAFT_460835 [Emiliania huxleyi CCMP1516]
MPRSGRTEGRAGSRHRRCPRWDGRHRRQRGVRGHIRSQGGRRERHARRRRRPRRRRGRGSLVPTARRDRAAMGHPAARLCRRRRRPPWRHQGRVGGARRRRRRGGRRRTGRGEAGVLVRDGRARLWGCQPRQGGVRRAIEARQQWPYENLLRPHSLRRAERRACSLGGGGGPRGHP